MARLYNDLQVTGQDAATTEFIQVRDSTRKQAMTYMRQVLPQTEKTVKMIATYMDSYCDMGSFENWQECLDDIMSELREAQTACEFLRHMHNAIIVELRKNEARASVGVAQLETMRQNYEQERATLRNCAQEARMSADNARFWGRVLAPITLGLSAIIAESYAREHNRNEQVSTSRAVARQQNASIAQKASELTTTELIPAIQNFIKCLDACLTFVNMSKAKLERMIAAGDNGPKRRYYFAMNERAREISGLCDYFVSVTDRMRSSLNAIPENPADKNYVDQWLENQIRQFEQAERARGLNPMESLSRFFGSGPRGKATGQISPVGRQFVPSDQL